MKADPNVQAHQEWIGFVQPAGLVVSATALMRAGAILPRRDTEGQRLLAACVTNTPAAPGQDPAPTLVDFEAFARGLLGWSFSPKGFAGGPAGEIHEGAVLSMLLIAHTYHRLDMMQAAKQYALGASLSAGNSGEDRLLKFVARGLFAAAEAEYFAGAWCGAAELFDLGFRAVHRFSHSMPDDDETQAAMFNFARWYGAPRSSCRT